MPWGWAGTAVVEVREKRLLLPLPPPLQLLYGRGWSCESEYDVADLPEKIAD